LGYDPENKYSVPYSGNSRILYNKKMVQEEVDSWDILWDSKYKGQIIMMDSVRDTFAVALKRLGYSLNSTDKAQVDEAVASLIEQAPLVQAYLMDQVKDKMIGEEAALAVIYSGEAVILLNTTRIWNMQFQRKVQTSLLTPWLYQRLAKTKKQQKLLSIL